MPKLLASNLEGHRQLVRNSLLDAFDELLDERDYERISMSDIAKRAGVARNTIYNYANDKAALLLAAVRRSTDGIDDDVRALEDDVGRSAPERLASVIGFLLTSFTRGTHRVFVLQAQVGSLEIEDQAIAAESIDSVQASIARILDQGARSGEFREAADGELELAFISGVMAAAIRRVALEQSETVAIVDEATAFILRAVRP